MGRAGNDRGPRSQAQVGDLAGYKHIGIVHHGLLPAARDLARALEKRYPDVTWWSATQDTLPKARRAGGSINDTDLIVTIGGDGTILRGVHQAAPLGVPVLGVNMGRVGFMSELDADDAVDGLGWYLEGNARVEERAMLRALVAGQDAPVDALNDVIIARGEVLRVIELETLIDGVLLSTYRGDGVVVATATGSTGYALSLGGPVMDPGSRDILVKPVAVHMSQFGGVIAQESSTLEFRLISENPAIVSADGFQNASLHDGQSVRVGLSPHRARFLRKQPPGQFWASLSRRLGMRQGALPRKARADAE